LPHRIVDARARGDVSAFPGWIDFVQQVDYSIDGRTVGKGTEIEIIVIFGRSGDFQQRIPVPLQGDVWVMRIVHQHYVVAWVMRLDEIHLQDEGFFFGIHQDGIEMIDVGNHRGDFAFLRAQKILGDPLFQALGFSDIDDFVVFVLHQIAAWFIRKESDKTLQFLGNHFR
jgi:hypothetical protein